MANILFRTRGNANPKGKPRVYFTCHPADFEKYFDKVCEDIFKTHDCAIYYTEDMAASIPAEDLATDLGSNNLFVIPVTFKLLTQPNRAMDEDFAYAQQEHIPVLPFMMEPGMNMIYSRPDKFGKLQYLNPHSTDRTEISYEQKLKKYLESVLISDELAKRVRAAFDAYIFLSYRKKDRRYANELMRLIHRNPECRDIAIWYDEFLTPGESFQDSIEKILHSSKLFTLLVTPNLLEEPEGKPNFVMAQEYPAAREAGIHILPAEMEATDKTALGEKFAGIPDCLDVHDEITFHQQFLDALRKVAVTSNDTDPEHNFLIGLAYLEGIDVETDRERGLELITSAAEADLPEAMGKLHHMYDTGTGIQLNYSKTAHWAERLVAHFRKVLGEEHPSTLTWSNNLAVAYVKLGEYQKALELVETVYALQCKVLGQEHPNTLASLNNLAITYTNLGEYQKALELQKKMYALCCKVRGKEHPDTLTSLNNLAITYANLGEYQKALELQEKGYAIRCKVLGEEHPDTLTLLGNLALSYRSLGNYRKALELFKKAHFLQCKVLGEEHPNALASLGNLALSYHSLGNYQKALELLEKVYSLQCKILGEEHPDTLNALDTLATTYTDLGIHKKALETAERAYALRSKVLGKEHPDTLTSLNSLAITYMNLGIHKKALELNEKLYSLRCEVLGKEHPETLNSLGNLATTYDRLGEHQKALELVEKEYALRCNVLGEDHPDTIHSLNNLAGSYANLGDYQKAQMLQEKVCVLYRKILGQKHPLTLSAICNLATAHNALENYQTAIDLWLEVYTIRYKDLGATHSHTRMVWQRIANAKECLEKQRRANNVCQYCGGSFTGLFRKKCSSCGKPKDY